MTICASTGVAVATLFVTKIHNWSDTGATHSYPSGGNSSHMLPVVCGSTHSARTFPTVGAIVNDGMNPVANAVADVASCALRFADVPPVPAVVTRPRVNTTSLPAAAAVTPIFIRTPTRNARFVEGVRTLRIGDCDVVEMVTMPESTV